ncbi:MAG: hypothetical protein V1790_07795 [Planctomycetota bacterium]
MSFNPGDQYNTADMAMNANGFHGVGWVAYNNGSGLARYLVSFTKDNGRTWDASAREIGHYTAGGSLSADDIDLASNGNGSIGMLAYYKQTGSPTEPNSLVLYTYNKTLDPTLNNPVKTVIVAGSGMQFATNCSTGAACFALTGDGNDTFQAFYYQGGAAKVTTINNASTTPSTTVRTIVTNSSVTLLDAASTCHAASSNAGAAVVIAAGTGIGTYDVPASGNILKRTSNVIYGGLADSIYTMALADTEVQVPGIMVYRLSATGQQSSHTISDSLPYPGCPNPLTTPGESNCASRDVGWQSARNASMIGNVLYSSSFLQEMVWSTTPDPDQYLANVQRIVIHQTTAEP